MSEALHLSVLCSLPNSSYSNRGASSSGSDDSLARHAFKALEATLLLHILLQSDHPLLITSWVPGFLFKAPSQVLVRIVGLEAFIEHTKPLPILGHLLPVTLHVLQVRAEVREAALEDLAVRSRVHGRLEVAELLPSLVGRGEDKVSRALACTEESADFLGVLFDEGVVSDVQNRAEAAASELGELVDTKHLDFVTGTALRNEPLLEFDHLDVLEADAGVDLASDDGAGDVHANADGLVLTLMYEVSICLTSSSYVEVTYSRQATCHSGQ
jgi:hypothetical protein